MTTRSRRQEVFIATLGTSPLVVTTCLDLLLHEGRAISSVIVIHTTPLSPDSQLTRECYATCTVEEALTTLDAEFDPANPASPYQRYRPPLSYRRVAITMDGTPVDDVDSRQEAEAGFDTIYIVVQECKRAGQIVHLGIAGGSRTLAVYGIAVGQMLFDMDDRLWNIEPSSSFLRSGRLHPRTGEAGLLPVPVLPLSIIYLGPVAALLMTNNPSGAIDKQWEQMRVKQRRRCQEFLDRVLSRPERRVAVCLLRQVLYHHSSPTHSDLARMLLLREKTVSTHFSEIYDKMRYHFELYDNPLDAKVLVALFAPHMRDLNLPPSPPSA
jgi:CRISPR-associated protein (TIGR02584 family)